MKHHEFNVFSIARKNSVNTMQESVQKPRTMRPLGPLLRFSLSCSLFRCMLALLMTCLSIISSSCDSNGYGNYNKGLGAYEKGDYTTAFQEYKKAAEKGNRYAQNNLGVMYYKGHGVTKDYAEAIRWYYEAAKGGLSMSMRNLGFMYYEGHGVIKDYGMAARWFREAAKRPNQFSNPGEYGDADAAYQLGLMYQRGIGVPKDYVAAYMWYTFAEWEGYEDVSNNLEHLAKWMTPSQIAEAQRWKRNLRQNAANDWHQFNIQPIPPQREKLATLTVKEQSKPAASTTSQHNEPSTRTPALPPILSIEDITFSETVLDANETATLSIRIKNVGPGDAHNLSVKLASALQELVFPNSISVPTIPKQGGEKTVEIQIQGTLDLPTTTATLDIRLSESQFKLEIPGKRIHFETRQFQNPELLLADAAVLESTTAVPNNQINLNEMIDLKFYVQNTGSGAAENVRVTVENSQRGVLWVGVVSEKGRQREHPTFATIAAGKYELVTYSYLVNSEFTDTKLRFNIRATEQHGRWGFTETQTAAINTALTPLGTITELPRENNTPRRSPQVEELPALEIDVRKDIPETSTKNPNAVAVVIGNKNYTNPGVPDVAYAQNDALVVKQYLIDTLGYSEENIHYHINATKGVFEEIFGNRETYKGRLYDYVASDGSSDVFIYYSGHGAPDIESKQPYLVPTDANPSTVEVGGYPLKQLYLNLKQVPYHSAMVVIDSCFSGMSASGALIPGAKGYGIPLVEIPLLPPEKSVIFTATNKRQVANGYSDRQHSLFTYFFLKALRGEADVDEDNRLTVAEIAAYIAQHVPRTSRRIYGSSREQTPQVDGNRNLIIVRY